jgi:hypothetical protein
VYNDAGQLEGIVVAGGKAKVDPADEQPSDVTKIEPVTAYWLEGT